MDLKHFGDSYDIVKQSLLAWLSDFGPWGAHPMFTHSVSPVEAIAFQRFLGIDLLSTDVLRGETDRASWFAKPPDVRSVFLDPDTGLRLERRRVRHPERYVFADEVRELVAARVDRLVLIFDQSLRRGREREDVKVKLKHFRERGVAGFAYVSHASFLVVGQSEALVSEARQRLLEQSNLPTHRIARSHG